LDFLPTFSPFRRQALTSSFRESECQLIACDPVEFREQFPDLDHPAYWSSSRGRLASFTDYLALTLRFGPFLRPLKSLEQL
jgi:hypothetical protein